MTVKNPGGNTMAGATTYDAATRTVTFTPSAALAAGVVHTVTANGTDSGGQQVSAGGTWSFTTAQPSGAPGVCPCSLFGDDTQPTTLQENDTDPVTLGVRFSVDTPGTITGVRFYKGPNNTGAHTGTLWTATGTQLASGTFTGESTSGWQTLTFSTPVSVSPGTEYVASYRAAAGRYSTGAAFSSGDLSKGPLHVGSSAGAYTYGAGFPSSPSTSNYLVDVRLREGGADRRDHRAGPTGGRTRRPEEQSGPGLVLDRDQAHGDAGGEDRNDGGARDPDARHRRDQTHLHAFRSAAGEHDGDRRAQGGPVDRGCEPADNTWTFTTEDRRPRLHRRSSVTRCPPTPASTTARRSSWARRSARRGTVS